MMDAKACQRATLDDLCKRTFEMMHLVYSGETLVIDYTYHFGNNPANRGEPMEIIVRKRQAGDCPELDPKGKGDVVL